MSDTTDRESRILELRRQVQDGHYSVDPVQVASALLQKSGRLDPSELTPVESSPAPRSSSTTAGQS